MKLNTKSSITLPPAELEMVEALRTRLGAKTKVEVIRRGLKLLKETTDRKALRLAFQKASRAVAGVVVQEISELEGLSGEGLDE